jgi:hypothetical protein
MLQKKYVKQGNKKNKSGMKSIKVGWLFIFIIVFIAIWQLFISPIGLNQKIIIKK